MSGPRPPLACRLLGHRWSFKLEGPTIRWACARSCPAGGSRSYSSRGEAARFYRHVSRPPGPPRGLLAALGGVVDRTRRTKG